VRGTITLEGSAVAANFRHYQVEAGPGTNPSAFTVIHGPVNQLVEQGVLGVFDTTQVANGPYTLRLVVFDQSGGAIESKVRVLVDNPIAPPTPTPTATETVLPTGTPTLIPTATETVVPPSATPLPPTETPTNTPTLALPTETPTLELPTETPTITATLGFQATTEPVSSQ
jgi:hypothetical protein